MLVPQSPAGFTTGLDCPSIEPEGECLPIGFNEVCYGLWIPDPLLEAISTFQCNVTQGSAAAQIMNLTFHVGIPKRSCPETLETPVQFPPLPQTSCETSGRSLSFCVPQFPVCTMGLTALPPSQGYWEDKFIKARELL